MVRKKCSRCDITFETPTNKKWYCDSCEKLKYYYEHMGVDTQYFPQQQYKRMGRTQSRLYECKECKQYKTKTEFHSVTYERVCILCMRQPIHSRKLQKILGEYASTVENLNS